MLFPKEQFLVKLSRVFGTFPEVQMYSSSGKLRAAASPSRLLVLPCHGAWFSTFAAPSDGWPHTSAVTASLGLRVALSPPASQPSGVEPRVATMVPHTQI